jgi:hypothetical protein
MGDQQKELNLKVDLPFLLDTFIDFDSLIWFSWSLFP